MTQKNNNGFALIEVLIASAILSAVLLSAMSFQIKGARQLYHHYLQNLAVIQINNMFDRLRANRDAAFRQREFVSWSVENQALLPKGNGYYTCSKHLCTVSLQWQEHHVHHIEIISAL